jgi:hypothetical protein
MARTCGLHGLFQPNSNCFQGVCSNPPYPPSPSGELAPPFDWGRAHLGHWGVSLKIAPPFPALPLPAWEINLTSGYTLRLSSLHALGINGLLLHVGSMSDKWAAQNERKG